MLSLRSEISQSSSNLSFSKSRPEDYKKKIFGVINNFIYKNCISNYKDLADKNLDDKKISILIMNSIATLKLVIKELQNI